MPPAVHSALFFLLIAVSSLSSATADSINGCGGFVEASPALVKARKPSDGKLDYSDITVELRTVDGLVKDRTQCAPNGYYFIPVYDKGSFELKVRGPEGWSWLPEQVPVVIDNAGCNGNKDINFQFTGFTISGRVVGAVGGESCSRKSGGPSNINVELLSATGGDVSAVPTSSEGSYKFKNIIPGIYNLRASHPDLKVAVRGSTEVELGFGNVGVSDVFFVTGYDIRGSVVAQGNPILGVHIYLFSDDVLEVDCPQVTDHPDLPVQRKALCHSISDVDGAFTFKSVPCGFYELRPYYKGENTVFDVSPPVLSVSVEHQHVVIPDKFQVTGFSIGGLVVDGNNIGIEAVKIIVDGHERSITDKQGRYKLDQVTANRYTIEAVKDHYKFNVLKDFLVLPNMISIEDIKAVSYDVCGVVRMLHSKESAKVALTHGPENVKPQMKQIDECGNFCFEVPPGEYRLSALAASPESAPGVIFSPAYTDVTVRSPLLNVEFSQALVSVHGRVECKEKCGPSVSVALVRLGSKRDEERKVASLKEESSEFLFTNVLPGRYQLEVRRDASSSKSGEDNWCWDESFIDLDVGARDVKGITFVQKGYWINVVSTHDVSVFMTQPDGSSVNLKIKKGSQRLCVEFPGIHELYFEDSCIFFGSTSVKIDTSDPSPIYLKGQKYLLRGRISVDTRLLQLPKEITVDVLNSEGNAIDVAKGTLVSDGDQQTSTATFEYSVWGNIGDKLTFIPRDTRNDGEKKILFYPRQHQILVKNDGCQSSIASFAGRVGFYIEGSVSPPIPGVDVKVIATGDSHNTPLRKGEVALRTTTETDGSFIGGPLYDDISYTVQASKSGYHLKQLGPHSFSCQKLSHIFVRIHSKDDVEEPIPSVLLSLSGDDGYRNNSVSGHGGTFLFDNLFPGSFYLRPLLKEYAFTPAAQAVELGSGESREILFQATRVAYSATGVVILLSGQPKEGVSVEARSDSGFYEESLTDSSGIYRLRGLLPGTTYTIRVARKDGLGSTMIERASPDSVTIQVQTEDIKGMDFLVFDQPEKTILSCHVERPRIGDLHSNLLVEIRSATDQSKIVSVFPLPLSNFFQVKDLPKSKHIIQLRPESTTASYKFESELIEVDLEKASQIHVGPLRYTILENFHKQDLTPAPVLPLIAGVSVIVLFISMPRLKDLYEAIIGASTPGFSVAAKRDVRKPVVRKKTY